MKITDKKSEATFLMPQLPTSPSRLQVHRGHTLPRLTVLSHVALSATVTAATSLKNAALPGKWVQKTKGCHAFPFVTSFRTWKERSS